ncbi:MAG TPA: hypothetical protein P5525_02445 [Candidatus Paceibacterota bacterium]|nr:hypothetical protein [Candidatus Paceibacterota bacterium]
MKLLLVLTAFVGWAATAWAAELPKRQPLTVEQYCQLSIDRLEVTRSCWYWLRDGPTPDQLKPVWEKYKTTEKDFLAFGSEHAKEIDQYFDAKPELKAKVDAMSTEIREYVQRRGRDRAPAGGAVATTTKQSTQKEQSHEAK